MLKRGHGLLFACANKGGTVCSTRLPAKQVFFFFLKTDGKQIDLKTKKTDCRFKSDLSHLMF